MGRRSHRREEAAVRRLAEAFGGEGWPLETRGIDVYGPHGPTVTLPLPKKDVASLLDTTPESLSRQLRRLSDSGVIVQHARRRITIADLDALTQLSAPA